ncbi:hypothetical protein GobsT_56970 [Gemmata obscuriglobus]|uniref:Uncharacterized protein n=1 Tax=Gemmata obscuriglobus TaxID=114 RepID=A0A2Z3H054_9BACT|nr:hypothetical protein [Gemmata obscuriglobus]AWM36495.1 hypothetical protein C1280_05305 [Gemmata obscuriglobus]QEG30879.1 hypothetical protein GobsT_56970 [Gemmata obscuriglobus]VTS10212.1 unnamed protein product [Gemmata obscuriglobus UQM 2246]
MPFFGSNSGTYRAAGDVNSTGFTDGITETVVRRERFTIDPPTHSGGGFADLIAGPVFASVVETSSDAFDEAPDGPNDALAFGPEAADGIFVG